MPHSNVSSEPSTGLDERVCHHRKEGHSLFAHYLLTIVLQFRGYVNDAELTLNGTWSRIRHLRKELEDASITNLKRKALEPQLEELLRIGHYQLTIYLLTIGS